MAERTFIPTSPACGQWEMLLADALDGLLSPVDEATFHAHMAACPACSALYEEAQRGRQWLEFLAPEPEVPEGLVDRILAHTGPGRQTGSGLEAVAGNVIPMPIPAWQRPGLMGQLRRFAEPRLLMTAAMAFFSITLTMNMAGVRLSNMRLADLKPESIRSLMERRLTTASTPIIRYYDHLRVVYEVESRMRELRRGNESTEEPKQQAPQQAPGQTRKNPPTKDGSSNQVPEQMAGPQSRPAKKLPAQPLGLVDSEFMNADLQHGERPAHSGGSEMEVCERSTKWTA